MNQLSENSKRQLLMKNFIFVDNLLLKSLFCIAHFMALSKSTFQFFNILVQSTDFVM